MNIEAPQTVTINPAEGLRGDIIVPGDKSICHRAVILGALAEEPIKIDNFSMGEDNLATVRAFSQLGIDIKTPRRHQLLIKGKGLSGLAEPNNVIDAGNSGTSMRLLAGLLAGQNFFSVITGDDSLRKRPMKRVIEPLRQMGADITGRANGTLAPLAIKGGNLFGIDYNSPVASAQVKTCLLLAGLFARGVTSVTEPYKSRDHTERLMKFLGADIKEDGLKVGVVGGTRFKGGEITVPADISSAAFFIVGAMILPNSELIIKGVGNNSTRNGLLKVLQEMGGRIRLFNLREESGEPVADLEVKSSKLKGVFIDGDKVPDMIDEFPIFCVAAALAEGETTIRDAGELRVKETDRIAAMAEGLRAMGVEVEEFPDGMAIRGPSRLKSAAIDSRGDHRVAMAFAIAALAADRETVISNTACAATSFPEFFELIQKVRV